MSGAEQIRVFSVDDHPLLHEGLAAVIRHQSDMLWVAEASNGRDAIQSFREHLPDVTLMDLRLPDMSGIDAMIAIRSQFPEARIIILTTFANDVEVRRAFEAGVRAYLLKSMPPRELVQVIREVHAGKRRVPPEIAGQHPSASNEAASVANHVEEPLRTRELIQTESNRGLQSSQRTIQKWVSHVFRRK